MLVASSEFERWNPLRPVDWRWRRALAIVEEGRRYSSRRDDPVISEAIRFLRGLRRANTDRALMLLKRRMPALYAAYELHEADNQAAWLVQARLLAGLNVEPVAARGELDAAVVDLYEHVFFNVRDRLDARSYILKAAIGREEPDQLPEASVAVLLRKCGYFGGPLALEKAAAVLLPSTPGQPVSCGDQAGLAALRINVLARLESARLDELNPAALTELCKTTQTAGASDNAPFTASTAHLLNGLIVNLMNGNKSKDEDAKKITVVNGDDGTWSVRSEGNEISKGTSTFDPTKKPKTIDFTPTEGGGKGDLFLGIYKLGKNTRKLCFAPSGKERPTEFSSSPDNRHILVTFERVKSE